MLSVVVLLVRLMWVLKVFFEFWVLLVNVLGLFMVMML